MTGGMRSWVVELPAGHVLAAGRDARDALDRALAPTRWRVVHAAGETVTGAARYDVADDDGPGFAVHVVGLDRLGAGQ